jgi:hypothetical protein
MIPVTMLNANEQLGREDSGKLLLINEATSERAELPPGIGGAWWDVVLEGGGAKNMMRYNVADVFLVE